MGDLFAVAVWSCTTSAWPLLRMCCHVQLFRGALVSVGFREVQLPKLVAGAGEGGAAVFTTDFFGQEVCLAQSPQLHKQMAICSGMSRVFTTAPVFR